MTLMPLISFANDFNEKPVWALKNGTILVTTHDLYSDQDLGSDGKAFNITVSRGIMDRGAYVGIKRSPDHSISPQENAFIPAGTEIRIIDSCNFEPSHACPHVVTSEQDNPFGWATNFEVLIGDSTVPSALTVGHIYPSGDSWAPAGDAAKVSDMLAGALGYLTLKRGNN